jgi:hypothetical protein
MPDIYYIACAKVEFKEDNWTTAVTKVQAKARLLIPKEVQEKYEALLCHECSDISFASIAIVHALGIKPRLLDDFVYTIVVTLEHSREMVKVLAKNVVDEEINENSAIALSSFQKWRNSTACYMERSEKERKENSGKIYDDYMPHLWYISFG